jgi:hypothetical protein
VKVRLSFENTKSIGAVGSRIKISTCSGWSQVVAPKAGAQATLHHPAASQLKNSKQPENKFSIQKKALNCHLKPV